jgi:hypothetical protein
MIYNKSIKDMKKIFFAFFIMLFVSNIAFASESQNVWGHAWSDNIGWISFNCDNVRNGTNDCSGSDYGVNIKTGGCFEGYAWSDNLGWISFDQTKTDAPPTDETTGDCLAEAYEDSVSGTTKIKGWARVLSGKDSDTDGFDGWIKFNGTNIDTGINNNSPREFTGYAWGDVVNGWIQLSNNAKNFAVYTNYTSTLKPQPPTDLNANLGGQCQYNITFSWKYNPPLNTTMPQTCYEIEFSNGKTIKTEGIANSISRSMLSSDFGFAYNTNYTFKVRTTADINNCNASLDKWSDWSGDFSFKSHREYPYPIFTFDPEDFNLEDLVKFDNTTDDKNNYSWQWTLEKQENENGPFLPAIENTDYQYDVCGVGTSGSVPTQIPCSSISKSPLLKFKNLYNYAITLSATDSSDPNDVLVCSYTLEKRPAFEKYEDCDPNNLGPCIDIFSGSMAKFGAKILSIFLRPLKGLDFWR